MKQKLKKRLFLWGSPTIWLRGFCIAIVLCMSLSCKKDDPSVCGSISKNTCIANLTNARVDFEGIFFDIENYGFVQPCITCEAKVENMKLTPSYVTIGTKPYKYRLWGQIYRCDDCPIISTSSPKPLSVYVEKVEKSN